MLKENGKTEGLNRDHNSGILSKTRGRKSPPPRHLLPTPDRPQLCPEKQRISTCWPQKRRRTLTESEAQDA